MKRLPLLPTLIVGLAVAVMIGLGLWQLQRKAEKEALIARYAAAAGAPPVPWRVWRYREEPLYRRSSANCEQVLNMDSNGGGKPQDSGWRSEGGRNIQGESGWVHVATCYSRDHGVFDAVMGWSKRPETPQWSGGLVTGVIAPSRNAHVRLVATDPAPGLAPARPPSTEDVPNNHLFYAAQWFFFAGAAALIYVLALRRRAR